MYDSASARDGRASSSYRCSRLVEYGFSLSWWIVTRGPEQFTFVLFFLIFFFCSQLLFINQTENVLMFTISNTLRPVCFPCIENHCRLLERLKLTVQGYHVLFFHAYYAGTHFPFTGTHRKVLSTFAIAEKKAIAHTKLMRSVGPWCAHEAIPSQQCS